MANRPQGELEGLTPERLLSIAKVLDHEANLAEVYDRRGMGGSMGTVSVFSDAAALCRAVAGAERWMLVDPVARTVSAGTRSPDRFEPFDTATGSLGLYPTLAAALASLNPEAGGTV